MSKSFSYVGLVLLHVVIGYVIYSNEFLAKAYFWGTLFFFLFNIISAPIKQKPQQVLYACAYFVGAEILLRMTRGAISYEATKYLVIVFALIGIFYNGLSGKGYPYFLYIMLLIPSIFVASTTLSFDANFRTNIAFVLSGPICLGVAALFCYDRKVTSGEMSHILLLILLPIIALTTYIYFYTPTVKDVLSGTGSNRAASGGWGANQVSTVLGLGVFILTIRLFVNSNTLFLKVFNLVLLVLVSFRALVTFSRGGVITAIVTGLFFLLYFYFQSSSFRKGKIILVSSLLVLGMTTSWFISQSETGGLINLRYANKDHLGRDKEDISTGRRKLFIEELEGFIDNPFFGIGSSRAKDRRIEVEGQGVTSHSEVSRILAEHGILGIIILLILIFKPFDIRRRNRSNYYFYAFLCFWFATINHSSMRIAAPALVYALTLLRVTNEKEYSLSRKLLKTK